MSTSSGTDHSESIPAPPGRGAHGSGAFVIFIVVAFSFYAGVNAFLFVQITLASHLAGASLLLLEGVLLAWALAFPLGRMLPGDRWIPRVLRVIGSWYLAVMAYALLLAVVVDLALVTDHFIHWLPVAIRSDPAWGKGLLFSGVALVLSAVISGSLSAGRPRVLRFDLSLKGFPVDKPPLVLAMISDLHAGAAVSPKRVAAFIRKLEKLDFDLVCIVGDLVDETPSRLRRHIEPLRSLHAAQGVYAVTGNHEYYNGRDESVAMMREHGIRVLEDEAVEIAGSILLIGVEDRPGALQRRRQVEPLDELLAQWKDHPLPKVLLHHTPVLLSAADRNGVALQLSGHTHGGQLWPFGGMAKRAYGISKGWKQLDRGMKLFVSTGLGTWGPPVRLGNPPEIVLFTLHG